MISSYRILMLVQINRIKFIKVQLQPPRVIKHQRSAIIVINVEKYCHVKLHSDWLLNNLAVPRRV